MSLETSFFLTPRSPPSDLPCLPHLATSHSVLLKPSSAPPSWDTQTGSRFSHCNVHHLSWEEENGRCPSPSHNRWMLCGKTWGAPIVRQQCAGHSPCAADHCRIQSVQHPCRSQVSLLQPTALAGHSGPQHDVIACLQPSASFGGLSA